MGAWDTGRDKAAESVPVSPSTPGDSAGDRMPLDALGVRHETFGISRHLDAPPAAVFAAFAETTLRRRWFRLPGAEASYHHDFCVGGGETGRSTLRGIDAPPEQLEYRLRYIDLAPSRRIVYSYEAVVNHVLRWASLVTIRLQDEARGTRLEWTEQVAFLARTGDGSHDLPHLRGATALRLNGLAMAVASGDESEKRDTWPRNHAAQRR